MENIERIYRERRISLFRQLQKTRTVIHFILPGKNFQRLSIVTGLALKSEIPCLLIDPPRGIEHLESDSLRGRIVVQFIGVDRLPYVFRTTFYKRTKKALWIKLPAYVERIQRRKGFRITPPHEMKLRFFKDGNRLQGEIRNISEGGALVSPSGGEKWEHLLNENDTIREIHIECTDKKLGLTLDLSQGLVKRMIKESMTGRFYYALQFSYAKKENKQALLDWLYNCQRDMLQTRYAFSDGL